MLIVIPIEVHVNTYSEVWVKSSVTAHVCYVCQNVDVIRKLVKDESMAGTKQNWSVSETNTLIEILKELRIVERLDGRKARNSDLFIQVHERLKEAGIDRTTEQIKNRWKSLKSGYYKAKLYNSKSGFDPSNFQFYRSMDELMGDRPLSKVPSNGVDVGFEEEEEDGSDTHVTQSPDATEDGITDESSNEGADITEQSSTDREDSGNLSTESTKKRKRPSSSGYAKAMCAWSAEQQTFLEKLQESKNRWTEEQEERRLQREERLLSRFIEESSRSNERLVGHLLDGLRAIIPPPPPPLPPPPVPSYPAQHPYHNYSGSTAQHKQKYNYSADYTLQDL